MIEEEDRKDAPRPSPDRWRTILICLIMGFIETHDNVVEDFWNPPMTASGEEIAAAREIEKLIREVWKCAPPKPPPFRAPRPDEDPAEHSRIENARVYAYSERRTAFRHALSVFDGSPEDYSFFPTYTHKQLHRIAELMKKIQNNPGFS